MTADKHILPKCHDFWQSMFCITRPLFFSPYCSTMSVPLSPLEIRNYTLQKFSISYWNQSIHKAGNGLCLITGNNGSQGSPLVGNPGRHWVILSNKVLACALDRLERMAKKAAEYLGCIVSFLWQCVFQEHWKASQWYSENPNACWMHKINETLQKSQKQQS